MRLIDADTLKRYIPTQMDMQDLYLPVHFETLIDEQPTIDAVEVVRCKECKYYDVNLADGTTCFCTRLELFNEYDWFCADGEEKDDGK